VLDVETRDGAARLAKWTVKGAVIETPVLAWPDTPRFPAPADAALVVAERREAREPATPWLQDLGSLFRIGETVRDASALAAIPPDLAYSPSVGDELLAAGDAENRVAWRPGDAFVLSDPSAGVPKASELIAVGSLRALIENPYRFAERVTRARDAAGYARLLYAPGSRHPRASSPRQAKGSDAPRLLSGTPASSPTSSRV
jgi:hypothetical protein